MLKRNVTCFMYVRCCHCVLIRLFIQFWKHMEHSRTLFKQSSNTNLLETNMKNIGSTSFVTCPNCVCIVCFIVFVLLFSELFNTQKTQYVSRYYFKVVLSAFILAHSQREEISKIVLFR